MCRIVIASLLLFAFTVKAAEPERELLPPPKEVENILPPPKEVENFLPAPKPLLQQVPMGPMGPILPGYFRPDPRAQWDFYALDRRGFLKPRVVLAPQPYYLYNGQPYYFLQTNPMSLSDRFGR